MVGPPRFLGIGIPWYRRADYERIREIMAQRDPVPDSFDEWETQAKRVETHYQRGGQTVVRVYIDPQNFVAWCALRNLHIDAEARMAFAADPSNWPIAGKH